jgi:predicted site-specific integrase-resolvase
MTQTPRTPEFMSPREASAAYPVAYVTLLRWLSDGTLTRYTKGGGTKLPRLMIKVAELDKLLTPTPDTRVSA